LGQLRENVGSLEALMALPVPKNVAGRSSRPRPKMLSCRRLTDEESERLVQAYRNGATLQDLVTLFEVSQSTVLAHLDRHGVARRQPVGLSPEQVKNATRLYESGLNLKQVGAKLGFDSKTVRKYLTEAGVTIRPVVLTSVGQQE
jgi:DNA-binding CsgD family transcriptional regulator